MTDLEREAGKRQSIQLLNELPEEIVSKLYDGRYDRLVRKEQGKIIAVEAV
ncbi:MAG: hypothetical protein PHP50_10150 [Lachnospiraceae bacterium]|nr:hypothetical protein [Lachnospiraceae bacterium]